MRSALRFTAIIVVVLCLLIQSMIPHGWGLFGDILLWPVVGLMHLIAHSVRSPRSGSVRGSRLVLITVSHLLFIVAFLLQCDQGDSTGWVTFAELFHTSTPGWWPIEFPNIALFTPVFVTWVLLLVWPVALPAPDAGQKKL
jgi:hypothetical protein